MKTLEELDELIRLDALEANRLREIRDEAEREYESARTEWCNVYLRLEELKRRRAILAELLETYRGQDKLAV